MTPPLLGLEQVTIGYGELTVVHDVTLALRQGEFVSILGPSGCGKSTLLRAIAGFVPVKSGQISLNREDVTRQPPEDRDVGIVFQNYALFPTMSVFENIAFGLRVAGTGSRDIRAKVDAIAEVAGILDQLPKRPAELSGGQQQRVAIARSLIMGTKVLLFDEPLSNLDAKVRQTMRREIRRLQAELGFTALFVTHDQDEALSMSDRIVVLNGGRVEQAGTAREIYRSPQTAFVCHFIGAANALLPASAARLFPKLHLQTGESAHVRCEDLKLVDRAHPDAVEARLETLDFTGREATLTCCLGEERLDVIIAGHLVDDDLEPGKALYLAARENAAHIYRKPVS
ncbi:ABC transporter ATP-binding protein [Roseibium album]|uniref:ABC transporter ATP-binding protein n=1 Tax=Roseibium album TaxID=311410 RepID=UPI0024920CF6|nr:ABC transporter ATP-binding protein [Roseibium album]